MKILFFASLKEQVDCESEQWQDLAGAATAGDVKKQLQARGEPWASALDNDRIIISVNQDVADQNTPIHLGDEVAFFPPVTGG